MLPREHTAPYAPLFGTIYSLVRHRIIPREHTAPYAPLFGTVSFLVWHRMLPCSAPYAPLFDTVCSLVQDIQISLGLRPYFTVYPSSRALPYSRSEPYLPVLFKFFKFKFLS